MTANWRVSEADHPRSCGANVDIAEIRHTGLGSSPLVRGQPSVLTCSWPVNRIIPARAGPTHTNPVPCRAPPDHPRSCGANYRGFIGRQRQSGSSPLVRGQPTRPDSWHTARRIIPARAGPTHALYYRCQQKTDHPRSCGANGKARRRVKGTSGSSPLVRGQRTARIDIGGGGRIIPARAGPTTQSQNPNHKPQDHPRSCGANSTKHIPRH